MTGAAQRVLAADAPVRRVQQSTTIIGLLDWAFRIEKAQLVFDEISDWTPASFGMEYLMIEQARLGCRVDGGGSSPCHPDADLVADAVAQLPEGCGGMRMAMTIAEHARLGTQPCWGKAVLRATCQPVEWKRCKHGRFAAREFWTGVGRWPEPWLGKNDGYACPVYYSGTAREVGSQRRNYLQWRLALLELRNTFRTFNNLSAWKVGEGLPEPTPWLTGEKVS